MNEKILKIVLSVIPTILLVVCVIAAFAAHGWNVQATLFSENPLETVERLLPSEIGAEEAVLEVIGSGISEDRSTFTIEAVLHSPLNVPILIKEMSAEATLAGSNVTISLPSDVEIPAKGSANLMLEGSLPEIQAQMPPALPSKEKPLLSSIKMKLDISGIELEMEESGARGN